jgi:putative chitinase
VESNYIPFRKNKIMARLTSEMLRAIMPLAPARVREPALRALTFTALVYEITTRYRLAAWLATIAQESGELRYQQEIASGSAYEGRVDLGNVIQGDGRRFKGRGRIQGTGRKFYVGYTAYVKERKHLPEVDFVATPERLAEEPYATDAAGWFVNGFKNLNPLADAKKFLAYSVKVNGVARRIKGVAYPNHWSARRQYYERALAILPDGFELTDDDGLLDTTAPITSEEAITLEKGDGYPDIPIEAPTLTEKPSDGVSVGQDPKTPSQELIDAVGAKSGDAGVPVSLTKERPSRFTLWMTAIKVFLGGLLASLTTFCGANEAVQIAANKSAERAVGGIGRDDLITLGFVLVYVIIGILAGTVLIWIASVFYDRSANRANKLNAQKMEHASDTGKNTVELN